MDALEAGRLLGGAIGSVLMVLLLVSVTTGLFLWPLLAWSLVLNIRRIRMQLERLNDNIERRPASTSGGILGL